MKKIYRWASYALMSSALFAGASCQREQQDVAPAPVAEATTTLSEQDRQAVAKLKQAGLVATELVKDAALIKEIYAGINTGFYAESRIRVKDLLEIDNSPAFRGTNFRTSGQNGFSGRFEQVLRSGTYQQADQYSSASGRSQADELLKYLKDSEAAFYLPYAEDHAGKIGDVITIVSDPGDNPNVAKGFRVKGDAVTPVTIDEAYVQQNPTFILTLGIRENKKEATPPMLTPLKGPAKSANGRVTGYDNTFVQVTIGCAKLLEQMDPLLGLFNSGDSEIRFARGSGYLKVADNGQVQGDWYFSDVVTFTRSDISNRRSKTVNRMWDPNWVEGNTEQVLAMWEEDTEGSITFKASITTKMKIFGQDATGTAEISTTVKSKDTPIYCQDWDRATYIRTVDTYTDGGLGGCNNWWFQDAGRVQFTWPFSPWIP